MREELLKLTEKIENVEKKIIALNEKKDLYKSAKGGFIDSFGMMSVGIVFISLLAFFTLDILPSFISGLLSLLLNTTAIVLFVFAIQNNKGNLKILNRTNLKNLNLELDKCEKDLKKYDKKYNKIVETVILGDNF